MKAKRPAKKLRLIHRASGNTARVEHLGPYAIESLISLREEGAATFYRVAIAPRQKTRTSFHRVAEEFYFVLSGRGTAILGGRKHKLAPGDFLRLPPGTTHAFTTTTQPLEMINIHIPGCRPDRDTYFTGGPPPAGFQSLE